MRKNNQQFFHTTKIFIWLREQLEKQILKHSTVINTPFFAKEQFPWTEQIEKNIHILQEEFNPVMARVNDLPAFQDISIEQELITQDQKWKIYPFIAYGKTNPEFYKDFPRTSSILNQIPDIKSAMYSILEPGKEIPSHRGPYRGVLRLHIPLLLPGDYQNCKIRVGDQIRCWEPGKCLIFDDGYEHQVWNHTLEQRAVLFIDFLRPMNSKFWNKVNSILVNTIGETSFIKNALNKASDWYKTIWKK